MAVGYSVDEGKEMSRRRESREIRQHRTFSEEQLPGPRGRE
jgi:hypothetical protein